MKLVLKLYVVTTLFAGSCIAQSVATAPATLSDRLSDVANQGDPQKRQLAMAAIKREFFQGKLELGDLDKVTTRLKQFLVDTKDLPKTTAAMSSATSLTTMSSFSDSMAMFTLIDEKAGREIASKFQHSENPLLQALGARVLFELDGSYCGIAFDKLSKTVALQMLSQYAKSPNQFLRRRYAHLAMLLVDHTTFLSKQDAFQMLSTSFRADSEAGVKVEILHEMQQLDPDQFNKFATSVMEDTKLEPQVKHAVQDAMNAQSQPRRD